MNRYPLWKYAIIAIAIVVSIIYAVPNLFGEVPAVQVSPSRGSFTIDDKLRTELQDALKAASLPADNYEQHETALLALISDDKKRAGISVALNEIFAMTGVHRFGLVTPYRDDVQAKVISTYGSAGFECIGERHLNKQDNFSFSEVSADTLREMAREVAKSKPDAITIFCTNLRGAPLAEELEAELGIPVYDTISTVVWKALRMSGIDTSRVTGWGSLFREVA